MPRLARCLAALLLGGYTAAAANDSRARIAVVIDDLGHNLEHGRRVIRLPGSVACAVLPHTPYDAALAREAHAHGKEVILHLPMESADKANPGPGALHAHMGPETILAAFASGLRSVPHAVGVSNHMGSLLTERVEPMRVLMRALAQRPGLLFLDSRTSPRSVAIHVAGEQGVPHLARDVFLDNERDPQAVAQQFARLLELAYTHGTAVAIGHPYPETLALLERELPRLAGHGAALVSLKELLRVPRRAQASAHGRQAVSGNRIAY